MRNLTRASLCLPLLLSVLTGAPGQERKPPAEPPGVREVPEPPLELLELVAPSPLIGGRRVGQAEVKYYSDYAEAEVTARDLRRWRGGGIDLKATFAVPGAALSEPRSVQLLFTINPARAAEAGRLGLRAVSDGKEYDLGAAKRTNPGDEWAEYSRTVRFALYKEIVGGRRVSFRLGATDIPLDARSLRALRDLYRAVAAEPPARNF